MPAYMPDDDGPVRIIAKPDGQYGFGTIGLANPGHTLTDAWRMVERAGLARFTDRDSARIVSAHMGTVAWVEYDLASSAKISDIPTQAWR